MIFERRRGEAFGVPYAPGQRHPANASPVQRGFWMVISNMEMDLRNMGARVQKPVDWVSIPGR